MAESCIVVVYEVNGVRRAKRHELAIPLEAARGHYDKLSDRALNDLIKDLTHEQMRRQEWL